MLFTSSNQWLLISLTSYGIGCALPEYAGIYTRVTAFQNWINSTMNNARIQTSTIYDTYLFSFLSILLHLNQ